MLTIQTLIHSDFEEDYVLPLHVLHIAVADEVSTHDNYIIYVIT